MQATAPNVGAVSQNIRRKREEAGISQGRLAMLAGLVNGQSQISTYERGIYTPSLAHLIRLAKALGCSLDELTEGC